MTPVGIGAEKKRNNNGNDAARNARVPKNRRNPPTEATTSPATLRLKRSSVTRSVEKSRPHNSKVAPATITTTPTTTAGRVDEKIRSRSERMSAIVTKGTKIT